MKKVLIAALLASVSLSASAAQTIRFATEASYPPFESTDSANMSHSCAELMIHSSSLSHFIADPALNADVLVDEMRLAFAAFDGIHRAALSARHAARAFFGVNLVGQQFLTA